MSNLISRIPQELMAKLEAELAPEERLVWIGMPRPRFFTAAATGAFLFSIPWTAFTLWFILGMWGVTHDGDIPATFNVFALFGLPFLFIGIAMMCSPLWTYWASFKTVYAVTDRRAITIDQLWNTTIRSYLPEKLHDVFRRERRDGTGDVLIARKQWRDSDGEHRHEELGFLRIQNPREVEAMLRELAARAPLAAWVED